MSGKKASKGARLEIRTATPSSVRAVNRTIVLDLIRRKQPVSRAELARLTGIFRSSVSDIVDELVDQQFVSESPGIASQRGRVPVSLRLNDLKFPVLGLNIRPEYCQLAWAGVNGRIHDSLTFATPTHPKKLVRAFGKAVTELLQRANLGKQNQFGRIGIAVPGHVDAFSGRIVWVPTHTELNNFPIADAIYAHTGIETLADNDCNVGALSELWLSADGNQERKSNFIFLNVSDYGTGAGAVINGEIYLGHDSRVSAEIGHIVIDTSGPLCRCGRHGCLELYVSNDATWKRYRPNVPFTVQRFEEMLACARDGEQAALESFERTAKFLSLGISNIGYLFNPAEVVIAGRITAIWDLIKEPIYSMFGSSQLTHSVSPAKLSADDSLLHGAVCLALRDVFAPPRFGELPAIGSRSA